MISNKKKETETSQRLDDIQSKDKVIVTLNNKLGMKITNDDVDYALKLKTGESQSNTQNCTY